MLITIKRSTDALTHHYKIKAINYFLLIQYDIQHIDTINWLTTIFLACPIKWCSIVFIFSINFSSIFNKHLCNFNIAWTQQQKMKKKNCNEFVEQNLYKYWHFDAWISNKIPLIFYHWKQLDEVVSDHSYLWDWHLLP